MSTTTINLKSKFKISHQALDRALVVPFPLTSTVGELVKDFSRRAAKRDASIASEHLILTDVDGNEFDDEDVLEEVLEDSFPSDGHHLTVVSLPPVKKCAGQIDVVPCAEEGLKPIPTGPLPKPPAEFMDFKEVSKPETRLDSVFTKYKEEAAPTPKEVEVSHSLETEDVGRLIGKKGATRAKIERDHGVKLRVKKKSFSVCGPPDAVEAALAAAKEAMAWRPETSSNGPKGKEKKKVAPVEPLEKPRLASKKQARQGRQLCKKNKESKNKDYPFSPPLPKMSLSQFVNHKLDA